MEKLLTPKEVAEILCISVYTLLYGSLQGEIPKVYIRPRKPRYRQEDIKKYINKKVERLSCLK